MNITSAIKDLASVDLLKEANQTETFVGRPFYLDYDKAQILIADAWKMKVGGIPQGAFLLAFYENEKNVSEALLLRALKPTKLPTDNDVVSSIVEYYKDNLKTTGNDNKLDDFTRYEFSFSGLECRILGTFYKNNEGKTVFGADVENFYSSHNYSVYKPGDKVLEVIANLREGDYVSGNETDVKIGKVRYSSSLRFQENLNEVPVYISPNDFLGKRTALFGMTRTGKSNTVKKIIQATVEISNKSNNNSGNYNNENNAGVIGQIIFDINGEYANANLQDEGTAIFELFQKDVIRYSVLNKEDFKVMKVNFYNDIESGFELIRSHFTDSSDYVNSFKAIDWSEPESNDHSAITRYERKKVAYLCCLYKAGFKIPDNFIVKFQGNKILNEMVQEEGKINPSKGITLEEATNWFTLIWDNYKDDYFSNYKSEKGREWADEDLKALLIFLTRKKTPGGNANVSGFTKFRNIIDLHTDTLGAPFEIEIVKELRNGKIIIIDLSQGDPSIQKLYSERICTKIFSDSMDNFIKNNQNNFIQFYFEEAHNLFPKKDDKDLSQIYNRIAKEGAKLNLGLIYATQEVSSISSNILKNTQNWFIAHLNNEDELKELKKYYDFVDFTESLIRFSASTDKGFVRVKTYSNPFVIPVQIDRFIASKES
jgi:DNA helicase HerA-like ATPase